jgi:hypothetical protein
VDNPPTRENKTNSKTTLQRHDHAGQLEQLSFFVSNTTEQFLFLKMPEINVCFHNGQALTPL